jgi:hypothetical protein
MESIFNKECDLNHRKRMLNSFCKKRKKIGIFRECEIRNEVLMFPTGETTASSGEGFGK